MKTDVVTQAQQLAVHSVNGVSTFVLNFLAFIVIAVVLFLFGYRSGKGNLISLTLSLYIAFALYSVFPYLSLITGVAASALVLVIVKILLYLALCVVSYLILKRLTGRDYFGQSRLSTIAICILTSGFIIALLYHTFSIRGAYNFTPEIDQLFAPSQYFFWWFIAPLAAIFFLGR